MRRNVDLRSAIEECARNPRDCPGHDVGAPDIRFSLVEASHSSHTWWQSKLAQTGMQSAPDFVREKAMHDSSGLAVGISKGHVGRGLEDLISMSVN